MTYDVQLIAVAVIVGLAAAYVVRSAWRTWAGKKAGCGSGMSAAVGP